MTTDSGYAEPVAPNLLDLNFQSDQLGWVSDITYMPSREGWLYLTTIMDLADSMAVGATTIAAWEQACSRRRSNEELLFHSDRGSQYACADFTAELETFKVTQSMSHKGNCWDNARDESFFKTLKVELPVDTSSCSYGQVRRALLGYIDIWYNRKRLHSSLDNQTPVQVEHFLTQQPVAA